jgi:hypothetical protein
MEPEGSLLHSQECTTGPYPEPSPCWKMFQIKVIDFNEIHISYYEHFFFYSEPFLRKFIKLNLSFK